MDHQFRSKQYQLVVVIKIYVQHLDFQGTRDIPLNILLNKLKIPLDADERKIRIALAGFDPMVKKFIYIGLDSKVYKTIKEKKEFSRVAPIDKDGIFMASDGVFVAASEDPGLANEGYA